MPSNPLKKILERRGGAASRPSDEALEKLERGIRESRQSAMQQNAKLARDYFQGSVEALKRQVGESRATLEGLPEQIPGGQEDEFRSLVDELLKGYERIEKELEEVTERAANAEVGEADGPEPSDAAGSEDEEAEGAASADADSDGPIEEDGEVMESDEGVAQELVGIAEQGVDDAQDAGPKASDAARRKAEELGVELSEIEGTGVGGAVTVRDVTARLVESMGEGSDGPTDQDAEDVVDTLDITAEEDGAAAVLAEQDGAAEDDPPVAGPEDALPLAGADAVPDAGEGDEADGAPKATNAARRRAEELGVDLASITGSGAGGLITIQDVVKL